MEISQMGIRRIVIQSRLPIPSFRFVSAPNIFGTKLIEHTRNTKLTIPDYKSSEDQKKKKKESASTVRQNSKQIANLFYANAKQSRCSSPASRKRAEKENICMWNLKQRAEHRIYLIFLQPGLKPPLFAEAENGCEPENMDLLLYFTCSSSDTPVRSCTITYLHFNACCLVPVNKLKSV